MIQLPFTVTGNVSITAKGNITLNALTISGAVTVVSTEGSIALNDLTTAGQTSLNASTTIHAGITSNASGTTASGSQVHLAALALTQVYYQLMLLQSLWAHL